MQRLQRIAYYLSSELSDNGEAREEQLLGNNRPVAY